MLAQFDDSMDDMPANERDALRAGKSEARYLAARLAEHRMQFSGSRALGGDQESLTGDELTEVGGEALVSTGSEKGGWDVCLQTWYTCVVAGLETGARAP